MGKMLRYLRHNHGKMTFLLRYYFARLQFWHFFPTLKWWILLLSEAFSQLKFIKMLLPPGIRAAPYRAGRASPNSLSAEGGTSLPLPTLRQVPQRHQCLNSQRLRLLDSRRLDTLPRYSLLKVGAYVSVNLLLSSLWANLLCICISVAVLLSVKNWLFEAVIPAIVAVVCPMHRIAQPLTYMYEA